MQIHNVRREFGIFARSVSVKLLLNCYTIAMPLPADDYVTSPPSRVRYTNLSLGHQKRYRSIVSINRRNRFEFIQRLYLSLGKGVLHEELISLSYYTYYYYYYCYYYFDLFQVNLGQLVLSLSLWPSSSSCSWRKENLIEICSVRTKRKITVHALSPSPNFSLYGAHV